MQCRLGQCLPGLEFPIRISMLILLLALSGCQEGKPPNSFDTENKQAGPDKPPTYSGVPKDEAKK